MDYAVITHACLDVITHNDLRRTASISLRSGSDSLELFRRNDSQGRLVETLVVEDRAGQVTNGDAVWGDWDAETKTIRLDERGPEGEVLVAGLDGQQRPASASAVRA